MSTIFRSELMSLCQLVLEPDGAFNCVADLGELGLVQFCDLNEGSSAFKRKFINEVKRCDEMERKLLFLEREIVKDEMKVNDAIEEPKTPLPHEMIDIETTFERLESELKEVNANYSVLKKNYMELTELKYILMKTRQFFAEREQGVVDEQLAIIGQDVLAHQQTVQLSFIAGVVKREKVGGFERMLWRVCRNNVLLRYEEIDQPFVDTVTGREIKKCVFILFFQGDQLKNRIKKICDGFHTTLYPCPDSAVDRLEMVNGVSARISDLNMVIDQTEDHRKRLLNSAAAHLKGWFIKIRKMKAVYHTLNQFNFDTIRKCMLAELWCPTTDLARVRSVLETSAAQTSSLQPILGIIETDETCPTFVRTNKFSHGFQNLVDSYGIGDYREINPGPFAVITFPFIFAVMFGDAGHGVLMTLFAAWMVICENKLSANRSNNGEMWNIIFAGRYIILLMGFFSIYTGLIYNDIFSKSINVFGSSWGSNYTDEILDDNKQMQMDPAPYNITSGTGDNYYVRPYPFGIDPVWQLSQNKLTFLNSYKMKLSVILGVTQMLFGVVLSLLNHIYFRRYLNIFLEFIPQVIFLMLLFGYLCFLIVYKWAVFDAKSSFRAPNLLITLIDMFMQKKYMPLYDESIQSILQPIFVIVAILCVPWMLLIKPFVLLCIHKRKVRQVGVNGTFVEEGHVNNIKNKSGHHEEEFEFGEIFIHQAIHTIDYCLGCISNTASYLRLWALSLAHAQLSEVLWNMVMRSSLNIVNGVGGGGVCVWIIFSAWATCTVVILLVMEGLSAFLHALRLHWVEFQNKFYSGTGYLFAPFSFKHILDELDGVQQ